MVVVAVVMRVAVGTDGNEEVDGEVEGGPAGVLVGVSGDWSCC